MKAQPLLYLGDRRRRALLERIAASAGRWRQAWAAEARDTFEVECDPPSRGGFTSPVPSVATSAWTLEVSGDRAAVLLLPHGTFAWCVHAAGNVPVDGSLAVAPDSLAGKLEEEVARSLLTETCGIGKREMADVSRASLADLAEWIRAARAWRLSVIAAAGRGFTLLVSAARIDALAPSRAAILSQPLSARREAIGENTLTLRALVGETCLPVSELAGLALDDVLLLDQPLAEPIVLVSGASGAPVATGNLGRSGARRAVKITGHSASRS
jgi:hypothetical protein